MDFQGGTTRHGGRSDALSAPLLFQKAEAETQNPDPLVGRFFLSVSHCIDCHAVRLNSKGLVLERIPDAWAYVVKFYSWGEESRGSRFSMVVPGWNTADWSFYASMADLMMDASGKYWLNRTTLRSIPSRSIKPSKPES